MCEVLSDDNAVQAISLKGNDIDLTFHRREPVEPIHVSQT